MYSSGWVKSAVNIRVIYIYLAVFMNACCLVNIRVIYIFFVAFCNEHMLSYKGRVKYIAKSARLRM